MKKTYVKPQVYFENFQLSANIAAGCGTITKLATEQAQCGYNDGIKVIFIQDYTGCSYGQDEGSNSICYHTFEGNKLFTS